MLVKTDLGLRRMLPLAINRITVFSLAGTYIQTFDQDDSADDWLESLGQQHPALPQAAGCCK